MTQDQEICRQPPIGIASMVPGQSLPALADNWLLELVAVLLEHGTVEEYLRSRGSEPRHLRTLSRLGRETETHFRHEIYYTASAKNRLLALLHLLDIVVVYDYILYDPTFSYTWSRTKTLTALAPTLVPVDIQAIEREAILELGSRNYAISTNVVSSGALYYLTLARVLGVQYWPSPPRAQFIAENLSCEESAAFVVRLRDYLESEASEIVSEAVKILGLEMQPEVFPGFGSRVLADVEHAKDILPAAINLRESKAACAFRSWLREMELAMEHGDLVALARSCGEVRDVVGDIRRELAVDTKSSGEAAFQIGLSPSITMNRSALRSIVKKLRPKKLHATFIRQHLEASLRSANVLHSMKRLFPELAERPDW